MTKKSPLPYRILTRIAYVLAHAETPWLKNLLIGFFLWRWGPAMRERPQDPYQYPSFSAFFLRPYAGEVQWGDDQVLQCPVESKVQSWGSVRDGMLLQAKNSHYPLEVLLGGDGGVFLGGHYVTLYLAPTDYHRVHMPVNGTLKQHYFFPGAVFPVKPAFLKQHPRVFCENQRMVTVWDTAGGQVAVVMVAAALVSGIEMAWAPGVLNADIPTPDQDFAAEQGDELGRFHFGSTVIIIVESHWQWCQQLQSDQPMQLGDALMRAAP